MKVILYMAITANGMIAKKNGETCWSDEEFKSYAGKVKEIGAFIIGNKTLPLFRPSDFVDMGDPMIIVLTKQNLSNTDKIIYVHSAQEAFEELNKQGFDVALVTGGAETNKEFANYIDEIYLDIEPFVWGEGIPLFTPTELELNLKLLEIKKISNQTIQLHYNVLR